VRRKLYRYGGMQGAGLSQETWEFDGKSWRKLYPKHSPPPLVSAMMAFDPTTGTNILFGGIPVVGDRYGSVIAGKYLDQTWSWDGKDWKQLYPKTRPPKRFGNSYNIVTDYKNKRVVMYGGATIIFRRGMFYLTDTWEWTGQDWKQILSVKSPQIPRHSFAFGYHPRSGKLILFGGQSGFWGPVLNDTWELDGNTWTQLDAAKINPPSRRWVGGCYWDFISKDLWIYGGGNVSTPVKTFDEMWSWNGKKWTKMAVGSGKAWTLPGPKYMSAIGPLVYMDVEFYPGGTTKTLRHTETFAWQRPGWKSIARIAKTKYERGYYDRVVQDPVSGSVLRFSVEYKPTSITYPYGSVVEVFRLEGDRFEALPVSGKKPHYTTWTMPYPYYDTEVHKYRFFTGHVTQKDYGIWTFEGSGWSFQSAVMDKVHPVAFQVTWDPVRKKPVSVQRFKFFVFDDKKRQWTAEFEDKQGPKEGEVLYDYRRKVHVLFEPWSGPFFTVPSKVWELSGKKWKQIPTTTVPSSSFVGRKIVYVPELGGFLLAGGQDSKLKKGLPGTWLFDGKSWKKLSVAKLPERRIEGRMSNLVYDPGQRRVLAFYPKDHPHMFELSNRTLERSEPLVKRGESTTFEIAMPQQGGSPFLLGLSLTRKKGIPIDKDPIFGTRLFPLDFDSMLAWSLGGPILTILDQSGRGKIPFRIPKDPSIPEMDLWASGFTLDLTKLKVGEVGNSIPLQIIR